MIARLLSDKRSKGATHGAKRGPSKSINMATRKRQRNGELNADAPPTKRGVSRFLPNRKYFVIICRKNTELGNKHVS